MATYQDRISRIRQRQKLESQTGRTFSSSDIGRINRIRVNNVIKSINALQNQVMELGTQYNARYFDANGQALPVKWRADSGDWLKAVEPQWKANIAEVDALAEQLRRYKDYLDEDTYAKAMDAINASAESNRSIYTRAKQEHAAFSPFANEKDYNYISAWARQDEASALNTWNNLNNNLTLAYSEDNADMISEAEYALNLFADYYAGTGRSDSVSRMTQEYQQNRRIQRRDELNNEIEALEFDSTNYYTDKTGASPLRGPEMSQTDREAKINELRLERDQLNASINYYESHDQKYNQAMAVTGNADFAEISAIQNSPQFKNPTRQQLDDYDNASKPDVELYDGQIVRPGEESQYSKKDAGPAPTIADPLGMYLNATEKEKQEALDINTSTGGTWASAIAKGDTGRWDLMNTDDVAAYYYILNKEGTKAAEKFLDDISTRLLQRENKQGEELAAKASNGELVAAAALSIVAKPIVSIFSVADGIASAIKGEYYDPNRNPMARGFDRSREILSEKADAWGQKAKVFVPVGDIVHAITGVEVSELLNTGFSLGDSAAATAMMGPAGTVVLGMDAARTTADKVYEQGGSKEQIFASAFMAGAAETVFEYLSFDRFADKVLDGKYHTATELFKQAAIQGGVEASEEVFTEMANTISNGIIMGGMSDYTVSVEAYKNSGMTEAQAKGKATGDVLSNIWSAAVGGFLSGGARTSVAGSVRLGVNKMQYAHLVKQNAKVIAQDQHMINDLISLGESVLDQVAGKKKSDIENAIKEVQNDASTKNVKQLQMAVNKAIQDAEVNAARAQLRNATTEQEISDAQDAVVSAKTGYDRSAEQVAFSSALRQARKDSVRKTYTVGNGVTTNAKTGEEIRITGIYRTKENEKPTLVFKLDDGSTIHSDEVSYANDNMAVMAEALAETGIRADYAQKLLDSVTEEGNVVDTVLGMRAAIKSGSIGENYAMARKEGDSAKLTDKQFKAAYEAGQLLGKNKLNKQIGLASQKTATDANLIQEGGKFVGSFYDGTKTPVSALKNGDGSRTLTNTSKDGTVSSDDVKNMARNKGYAKREFSFQWKQFPPYDKSFSEANQLATRWAYQEDTQSGDTAYLSCNDRWYMIQMFEDVPSHYMVMERLSEAEYRKRKEKERYAYELSTSEQDGGTVFESLGVSDSKHGTVRDGKNDNHISMRNGSADGSVHGLGDQERSGREKYSLRRVRPDGGSQRRAQGSADPNAQGGQTVKTTESKKADGEPNRLSVAVDRKSLLRSTTQAQVNVLESMAKLFNVNIEIYASSVVNGERQFTDRRGRVYKGNAAYTRVGNTILVDVNAGDYLNGLMLNAVSHELVHYVREMSPEKFQKLADFVVEKFGEKGQSVTRLIRSKQAKYAAQGETLSFDEAYEEVVADSLESMLSQNADKVVSDVAELRKVDADLAKSLVDKLKDTVKKMLNIFKKEGFHSKPETKEGKLFAEWTEYHDQLTRLFSEAVADAADRSAQAARRTIQKENTPATSEVENSLRTDVNGNLYVQIDEDILAGVNSDDIADVVAQEMKQRFPNGFSWRGWEIYLTGKGIREFTRSKATEVLRKSSNNDYQNKMRMAANLDEIIQIADSIRNEIPSHVRKDKIASFNRAHVNISIANNDYTAEVITAIYPSNKEIFYDIVRLKPTTIKKASPVSQQYVVKKASTAGDKGDANNSISNHEQKSQEANEKNSLRNVTERQYLVQILKTMNTDVEHNTYFQEYLQKAAELDRKQAKVDALAEEWRELAYQKGKRSEETKERLQEIRTEITSLRSEINAMDNRLLTLGEMRPFRNLVYAAQKEQKVRDKEKMAEYRKEVKRRADRAKVVRALKDLGSYLTHESKDHHIPAELRKQFAEALDSFNLDYSKNGSKAAKHFLGDLADAIAAAQKTNSPLVTAWADSNITDKLAAVKELVGNTKLYYLNQEQLDAMYELFRMMKRRITTANKLHNENIKISATKAAEKSSAEISQWKTKRSGKSSQFGWDILKPYAFFERLGSDTLTKMYDAINQGIYKTARDLMDADKFRQKVAEKYGADSWKMSEAYTFHDATGTEMHLTLADIMSLYAHGRRNQSKLHLFKHGLVLNEEVVVERNADGRIKRVKVDDKKNHPINGQILAEITSKLTENQKAYCREMQDYLSDVMGRKGNEVSLELYDLELYTEKHYWPLKTAAWCNAFDPKGGVDPKINSPSFSKQTLNNASSPIVLNGFNEVWANHVSDMSLYHGLALPVDDITRVVNAHTMDNPVNVGGVRQTMEETYGPAAGNYLSQFLRDLNSGIRSTDDAWLTKGITLAKKAATALSLSVAIQQPSSIMRAMAVIEMKYFGRLDKSLSVKGVYDSWEELKQYCPVAHIKEMGNMETGHGRSAAEHLQKQGFGKASVVDILKDKNYRKQLSGKIDDIMGFLPQFMDQITWVKLWKAAQDKARAMNPGLSTRGIKLAAAKIFNETIEKTQVCDSPTSRTGLMRKGGAATKAATAFLAEPMTTINMAYVAILNVVRGKPGAKKQLGRTMGAILGSVVLNSILKSIVTAMRDDDEDETMIEKYIEHLVGNFLSDALLVTNLPYVRDIISLLEGYDVERMDMTTAENIVDSIMAMIKDGATAEEVLDAVFAVAGMFGIPLKNVKRDIKGIINTVGAVADEVGGKRTTTWTGIWSAALEGVPFTKEANKGDMLYRAYASGDSTTIQNYRAQYASETAANSGIKSALRDQRAEDIKKAAQLRYKGDVNGSARIVKQIARETNIPEEIVQQAVMAELSSMTKKKDESEYDGGYESKGSNLSAYTMTDLKLAVEQGRECDAIIDAIIADKKAQGATSTQAKSQVKNSLAATYKSKYMDAYLAGDKKEMDRIVSLLVKTGLWDRSAITNIMKNYIKNEEDSK